MAQLQTNIFNGAEERRAFDGLKAGYFNQITDEEAETILEYPLFPNLEMSVVCATAFYTGYLLGKEIRASYELAKVKKLMKKINKVATNVKAGNGNPLRLNTPLNSYYDYAKSDSWALKLKYHLLF